MSQNASPQSCQPTTTELVAKLIGGMGFEPDVAHHLTEIVKLSLEEGKASGRDEAADRIKRLEGALRRARISLNAVAVTTDSVSFHADVAAIDAALSNGEAP